jgi:hypothetical protein
MQSEAELTRLREYWLMQAVGCLKTHLSRCGLAPVQVRVSCGWPSRGGLGANQAVIGQCFGPQVCRDGVPQIFISPRLSESVHVLGVLLHELLHAVVGCQHGHRKPFSQAARKVGLEGPPTATVVGARLRPLLEQYVSEELGPYPHAAIVPAVRGKVGSRLRLYACGCQPPVKVRVASDDYQAQCLRCGMLFVRSGHEKEEGA